MDRPKFFEQLAKGEVPLTPDNADIAYADLIAQANVNQIIRSIGIFGGANPQQKPPEYWDQVADRILAPYKKGEPNVTLTRIEHGPGASVEQLIIAEAYFQVVVDKIKANGHEVPKTLQHTLDETSRDLNYKLQADRMRQLAALKLQRERLLSSEEKRLKVEQEIAELEKILGSK